MIFSQLSLAGLVTALAGIFFAVAVIGWRRAAHWKIRAKQSEQQIKANKKAHEIQNNIVFNPDERERVRKIFDRS